MADNAPISLLVALGAAPANGDLLVLVDISDATQDASGSTKKMTVTNLFASPLFLTPTFTGEVTAPSVQVSAGSYKWNESGRTWSAAASGGNLVIASGDSAGTITLTATSVSCAALSTTGAITVGNGLTVTLGTSALKAVTATTIVTSGDVVSNGTLRVVGGFGCNGAGVQTAFASGGAAPAGGTGTLAGAYDTSVHRDALITLVNNIRSALVAAGIMS